MNNQNVESNAISNRSNFRELLTSGTLMRQLSALLTLAAVAALGVGLIMWAMKPDMVPLDNNMGQQQAAQIADMLRTENIPFELGAGGGQLLVPANQLDMIRMKLAADGILGSSQVGIEMLQKDQGIGTSQFIQNARYQHALEIELSRSISAMRNVDTARVHLALPKQSVFIRDRTKPTASVMIKLLPGRSLEDSQVSAIVHLVASSIPHMEAGQVTIVDQWGRLLSSGDATSAMDQTRRHFEYIQQVEDKYAQRIEELLSPVLGHGRVRAKVSADIDFTVNEKTQELFDPDNTQIRSELTQEQLSSGNGAAQLGIPGVLSNQPPGAGTTDPNAQNAQAQAGNDAGPKNVSKQATRNFELDKTITHTRSALGGIKRLSVAVIVDDKVSVNEAGESVRTPLDETQIETLSNIVKEAIGFNQERGDSVSVFNQSFQPVETIEPVEAPPFWEQPWVWTLAKQLLVGIVILVLIFTIIKPAIRNLSPNAASGKGIAGNNTNTPALADDKVSLSQQPHSLSAPGSSAPALPSPPESYGDVLNLARNMAADDPKRVAKLIKDWVDNSV